MQNFLEDNIPVEDFLEGMIPLLENMFLLRTFLEDIALASLELLLVVEGLEFLFLTILT